MIFVKKFLVLKRKIAKKNRDKKRRKRQKALLKENSSHVYDNFQNASEVKGVNVSEYKDSSVTFEYFKEFVDKKQIIASLEKTENKEEAPKKTRIYCAGAMFADGEKLENEMIARYLESKGYTTYLPHRDGIEMGDIVTDFDKFLGMKGVRKLDIEFMTWLVQTIIFAVDIHELLEQCDAVVFNVDGRVPDEGAVSESAMAFLSGKPVIQYKKDCRSKIFGRDNPLLTGLDIMGGHVSHGIVKDLPERIEKALKYYKKTNKNFEWKKVIPPVIKSYLKVGEIALDIRNDYADKLESLQEKCRTVEEDVAFKKYKKPVYVAFLTDIVVGTLDKLYVPEKFKSVNMLSLAKLILK